MSGVASRTGLVKGTLHLYFPTEALLLELLEALLAEWFDDVDRQLARPGRWYARRAARVLATSLSKREPFARLLSIHGAILEHNIDEERARRFKRLTLERIGATGALLARRLPFLGPDGGVRLLLQASALIMGWGQMAYPAPVVRRVLDGAEFTCFRFDLAREFDAAIGAIQPPSSNPHRHPGPAPSQRGGAESANSRMMGARFRAAVRPRRERCLHSGP